jgi:hypothetical protein
MFNGGQVRDVKFSPAIGGSLDKGGTETLLPLPLPVTGTCAFEIWPPVYTTVLDRFSCVVIIIAL